MHYLEMEFQRIFQRILISKCQKRPVELEPVYHNGLLLFTPRTDGGIAMSIYCAERFSKNKKFVDDYCIEVDADSKPFVEQGKSVFCQHVKKMWFKDRNWLRRAYIFQKTDNRCWEIHSFFKHDKDSI